MSEVKKLLAELIQFKSITPEDAGCQAYMMHYLERLGFECQVLNNAPVANFFAKIGTGDPLLVFAGHTDVVPVGEKTLWNSDPFKLHDDNGRLYGRGTADMKGSLACMMLAAERFVKSHPSFNGSLGFLITSGEEGDHFDLGTPYVMEQLKQQNILPTYCIVGEPSSTNHVGDVIKIGRRGSLTANLTLVGKQGHVAYPHLASNPIHTMSAALTTLVETEWDNGNEHFPPTTMQITHIQSGGHAGNIIPGELTLQFNFRYSTKITAEEIKKIVSACFERHNLTPEIIWRLNGKPFLTSKGKLLDQSINAVKSITNQQPACSTTGGTSDGRFIAPYGVEVIELGPVNATIHQVNENVSLNDLETLTDIYYVICTKLLK